MEQLMDIKKLLEIGYTEEQITKMIELAPSIFGITTEKVKKVFDIIATEKKLNDQLKEAGIDSSYVDYLSKTKEKQNNTYEDNLSKTDSTNNKNLIDNREDEIDPVYDKVISEGINLKDTMNPETNKSVYEIMNELDNYNNKLPDNPFDDSQKAPKTM